MNLNTLDILIPLFPILGINPLILGSLNYFFTIIFDIFFYYLTIIVMDEANQKNAVLICTCLIVICFHIAYKFPRP